MRHIENEKSSAYQILRSNENIKKYLIFEVITMTNKFNIQMNSNSVIAFFSCRFIWQNIKIDMIVISELETDG